MTWEAALEAAGGAYLKGVVVRAGITPESLLRWSVPQVERLPRMGEKRVLQLREAARAVGVEWAPDYDPSSRRRKGRKPFSPEKLRRYEIKVTFNEEEWRLLQEEMRAHPTSSVAEEMRRRFFLGR